MILQRYTLDSYIQPQEFFHFTRKELASDPPEITHHHDYHEVFLIERGTVEHFINGDTQTLERGAMVFIRPSDSHAFRSCSDPACRIINLMFRSSIATHLVSRYPEELGGRFFWTGAAMPDLQILRGPRFERAVNSALELQTSRRSLARVEQFLLYIMTRVVDYSASLPQNTPLWLVNACIAARRPEVFQGGVPAFVSAAGRGHEHVCRSLNRYLGLSPSAYLNRLRMEHAAMKLGSSDMTLDEVARDCGLENLSHFYKLFRAQYGTTPRKYRQRHSSGNDNI